jgi:pyruvate formate lyase activating enzyme
MYKGRWWKPVEGGEKILCELCPRACVLRDGDRGFCFVRQNVEGEMVLTTYGRSTGFCIDPIEKKPLNHFLPGSSVLSFGTAGCNLGCRFCQNWEISKSREIDDLSEEASPEQIADAAARNGCRSVAYTYNDPVIWAEYAMDTARACRERGLKSVAVTAGYIMPEARREFYSWMDAANVDLKAFTELFYEQVSLARLEPVLDTLRWLKEETDVWFEITTLLIPTQNDSAEEVARMCDWLLKNLGDSVPLHFTAFHPDFRMQDIPPTPPATLARARQQALSAGLKHVYTGNVHDQSGQSSYCPHCNRCVIERNWYTLGQYHIKDGCCEFCAQPIAGVYEDKPGKWGAKRVPVFFTRD